MPVNAGIEYFKAEEKYKKAGSDPEKLAALLEMQRTVPKHKGTEKLRAQISKKIARLKSEIERKKTITAKKGAGKSIGIRKDGAGQIVVVGMPNSGKSTLLNALVGSRVAETGSYPFTTKKPVVGMSDFGGAKIQLVELPAIVEGSAGGKASGTLVLSLARNADAVCVVLSAGNAEAEARVLLGELEKAKILLNKQRPKIFVKPSDFKGFSVSGKKFLKIPAEELETYLKAMGYAKASVVLEEPTTLEKIAAALDEKICYRKAVAVLVGKNSAEKGLDRKQEPELEELWGEKVMALDSLEGSENIEKIKEKLFGLLGVVRVYTKKPGKGIEYSEPLVLKKGSTVENAAKNLHKDLAKKLKFARVWGSAKFGGQRVSKDYVLQDKDVVEVS